MAFAIELRTAALRMHSQSHLERRVPQIYRPTLPGVARYLDEARRVHAALGQFPVKPAINFREVLESDIDSIGRREKGDEEYAGYLRTLSVPELGCHWYNVVFAHVSGGGQSIYGKIRPCLPLDMDLSYFHEVPASDIEAMRLAFEQETSGWTARERELCMLQLPSVFDNGIRMLRNLNDAPTLKGQYLKKHPMR